MIENLLQQVIKRRLPKPLDKMKRFKLNKIQKAFRKLFKDGYYPKKFKTRINIYL